MSNYKNFVLIIWSAILIVANMITFMTTDTQQSRHYDVKLSASELMLEASNAIKDYKLSLGYPIEEVDINQTGLIGERYTLITTTLGVLESKRTSTNPNFAAGIVDMLIQAGVKEGDYVGMTFSGSFPALNIAASAAAEVMNLKVVIMASIGASSYGANNPKLTYVDMAEYLYEQGYFSFKPQYVSLGGSNDLGLEMPDDIREEILDRMISLNKTIIYESDFKKNITLRKNIFNKNNLSMKAFINVGGNLVSMGQEGATFPNKNGLITKKNFVYSDDMGLLDYFLNQSIPVIQILDIKRLAHKYGLPYDPVGIPEIGSGGVYLEKTYNLVIPIISVFVSLSILVFYKFFRKYFD